MGVKMRIYTNHFVKPLLGCVLLFTMACASIQHPTGGPKDLEPPKVLNESPKNLTRNFKSKIITIQFDEFFKLNNEAKEISISPAIDQLPIFKVNKKTLEIKFQDTLERNTTYTINFGKALVDYNEGNVLKNYSYVFATGNVIDSLTISGNVTNAITTKPELETTVFILPVRQDSLFGKKRASIFTTTDSAGNFTLKNLRADTYHIYALKEQGGDRIYNSSNEEIAFNKDSIVLKRNVSDVKLKTFIALPTNFKTLDKKIEKDGHMLFTFNTEMEEPSLQILSSQELNNQKIVEFNTNGDSALVWLPEMQFDSINVSVSNKNIPLDTVTLRRNKRDVYNNTLTIIDNSLGRIKPKTDLILTVSSPIKSIDETKISLLEDSISRRFTIRKDSLSTRKYRITFPWRMKRKYILRINDNAFTGIQNGKNKSTDKTFSLDAEPNVGNLLLKVTAPDASKFYVVQLLRNEKEIVKSTAFKGNTSISYLNYPAGKYTIRVVYDENKNGKWDTGNVKSKTQPENIWNYDKEVTLRTNFDIELSLTIPPSP